MKKPTKSKRPRQPRSPCIGPATFGASRTRRKSTFVIKLVRDRLAAGRAVALETGYPALGHRKSYRQRSRFIERIESDLRANFEVRELPHGEWSLLVIE